MSSMKPIRLSAHALSYTTKRGFTTDEVKKAIWESTWEQAELGRLQCCRNFSFDKEWNGKMYKTKQVRPVFVDEMDEIVVVTVYTYYF